MDVPPEGVDLYTPLICLPAECYISWRFMRYHKLYMSKIGNALKFQRAMFVYGEFVPLYSCLGMAQVAEL